ncbi:MAG: hypothetical protein HQL52_18405 [Magnetococcales bacterium]|nr:hypothetical protein [Magnetococcales bacterium]
MDTTQEIFLSAVEGLKIPLSGEPNDGRGYAKAHNFLFDTRACGKREADYHQYLQLNEGSAQLLLNRHTDYCENLLQTLHIPPTFLPGNEAAFVGPLDGNQYLVRVEIVNGLLHQIVTDGEAADSGQAFDLFREHLRVYTEKSESRMSRDDAADFLEDWLEIWNDEMRDSRPMFAAFEDDVTDLLKGADWVEKMRTQLGLYHIAPRQGAVYVALMKYPVSDVQQSFQRMATEGRAFAVPTVLDSNIWPYFFPAPADPNRHPSESYGRAMPLEESGRLNAELLHVKVNYKPEHLVQIAKVETMPPNHPVWKLRNFHLDALRLASEVYDFGEEIPEP